MIKSTGLCYKNKRNKTELIRPKGFKAPYVQVRVLNLESL